MLLLITLVVALLIPAPQIVIDIKAENGAAIVGLAVEFRDETGALTGNCVSDGNGRCAIPLSGELSEGQIVRGVLDFGASGVRSLIWRVPERPQVFVVLDEFGKVALPHHDVHPTPNAFSDVSPTPIPAERAPTDPPQYATTEYVIIDPTAVDDALTVTAIEEPVTVELVFPSADPALSTEAPQPVNETAPHRAWGSIILLNLLFLAVWLGGIWYYRRRHHA